MADGAGERDVVIRPVVPGDAAAWTAMREQLGPVWTVPGFAQQIERFFQTGRIDHLRHAVFVATDGEGGEPIGLAEVSLREYAEGCSTSPVGFLEGWFVKQEARGRGVGRMLVEAGERWAREQGCTEFASDAEADNAASIRAHKALGFENLGAVVCFRKSLG